MVIVWVVAAVGLSGAAPRVDGVSKKLQVEKRTLVVRIITLTRDSVRRRASGTGESAPTLALVQQSVCRAVRVIHIEVAVVTLPSIDSIVFETEARKTSARTNAAAATRAFVRFVCHLSAFGRAGRHSSCNGSLDQCVTIVPGPPRRAKKGVSRDPENPIEQDVPIYRLVSHAVVTWLWATLCRGSFRAKMMLPRFALALLANAILFLAGFKANAQDVALDQARDYFQAGAQAYAVGEYAAATQAFEQAYQLVPRPAVLFSIAQCERKQYFRDHQLEHLHKAVELYRRYLDEEPQGGRKADAVQALSELEPLVARAVALQPTPNPRLPEVCSVSTRVMITSQTPDARLALDGQSDVVSPLVREVEPGMHSVRVTAPGYVDSERSIIAVKGNLVTVDVALTEQPATLVVVAREGAQLSVDGRFLGECPFPKPLELPAGSHLIVLSKRGYVGVSHEQTLVSGHTTVVGAPMPRTTQRTAALIMLGSAASGASAGAVFAWLAHRQLAHAQEFLDARGRVQLSPADLAQYSTNRRDHDRLLTAAFASFGAGAALAIGGTMLFALDRGAVQGSTELEHQTSKARRSVLLVSAQPTIGPGFIGLGALATF